MPTRAISRTSTSAWASSFLRSLDRILSPLLKVDIEGAEGPLFSGNTSAFDRFPLIILEPHDWMLPGKLSSQPFFRFHAAAGREFCMNHENIASIALRPANPAPANP